MLGYCLKLSLRYMELVPLCSITGFHTDSQQWENVPGGESADVFPEETGMNPVSI